MTLDALDPGPNGNYPNLDMTLQPTGLRTHKEPGHPDTLIDIEATGPDGRRVSDIARHTTP